MPRNTKGGSGHKKQARKHQGGGGFSNKTRYSGDPLEVYAVCTKQFGQGHVEVMCVDGKTRLCVIRKKFKGRGKRDNNVVLGTWLLVGLREFECRAAGKQEKCDLLEVYKDHDKKNLQQHESSINWGVLKAHGNEHNEQETEDAFEFVDERTQAYQSLMEVPPQPKVNEIISKNSDSESESDTPAHTYMGGDDIDIDDI